MNDTYLNNNEYTTLTFGQQKYTVEVWIYNQMEGFDPVLVPTYAINELVIEETLKNWSVSGSITIKNDVEFLEKGSLKFVYNQTNLDQKKANFLFRSDARNKIAIRIKPIVDNDSDYPDEYWQMSFDCLIYDFDDLNTGENTSKLKKLKFVDERYQIFLEKNIEWSTSLYNQGMSAGSDNNNPPDPTNTTTGTYGGAGSSDISRTMASSEAIKSIISTASTLDSTPDGTPIKVGSSEGPKGIASPTNSINNFSDMWDKGSSDSYIQYTSPAFYNVLDDIDYVFGSLKASDGSPLILTFDRYDNPKGKQFSLVPLSYFFDNAEKNQVERLILIDPTNPKNSAPYNNRAPYEPNNNSNIHNFESPMASKIASYELIPMESSDAYSLNNTPIHSYDFSKGEFTIEYSGNTAKDFYNDMQNYTNGLYGYNNSKQLLLNINQSKQRGLMVNNNFISRSFFPKKMSGVKMMKDFLFLNQAISFNAVGLTIRAPGKVIFIDRDTSTMEKNPFDDKVLGQWLIIKNIHVFSQGEYTNNIFATKVDAYNYWWDVLDSESNSNSSNNY